MTGEITNRLPRWAWPLLDLLIVTCLSAGLALALQTERPPIDGSASPPTPAASPVSSPSGSPESSSSVQEPILPELAKRKDARGAASFLRYFFDVYNYAFLAQDVTTLREISDPSCRFCDSAIANVEKIRSNGSRVIGGRVVVVTAVAQPGDESSPGLVVTSLLRQEDGRTIGSDGSIRATTAATERRLDALVQWEGSRWRLVGVDTPT